MSQTAEVIHRLTEERATELPSKWLFGNRFKFSVQIMPLTRMAGKISDQIRPGRYTFSLQYDYCSMLTTVELQGNLLSHDKVAYQSTVTAATWQE